MEEDHQEVYDEGYTAYFNSDDEDGDLINPYSLILAEYWSDGWEDAKEDSEQKG